MEYRSSSSARALDGRSVPAALTPLNGVSAWARAFLLLLVAFALPACVTVRPEDKEFLANPAMTFGADGETASQEEHVLGNREGSSGGSTISGGGCGCN